MAGRQPAVGVAAKLVLWACSCGLALAADAVIYDSLEMTDLNFNVFPQNSQWTQVSFTNNSDVLSSMSVCAIGSGGNVSNWFRLPFMRAPDTDLLYIRLQFIMRDCSQHPDVVLQCKQVFGLLTRNANGSASSVPSWDQSASGYVLVQNVAADSTYRDSATATINTKEVQLPKNASSAGMFIAFHDQGTCVQIIRFVVLYKQCSQLVSNLVAFDKVPARSAPYAVTGRCVANAVPADSSAGSLSQICSHTGDWLQTFVPKCLCAAGYTPAGDGLSCSACGAGTFKMSSGNEQCSNCPPRSSSSATGAVSCPCNGGFYRALGEDGTVACTGPPSPVRSLTAAGVLSDRVTLTWLSPTDTGGRTDVLYSVVCDACPPAVTYAPMQTGLTVTRVSVFGLSSSTTYNFSVFSTNGVTKMSLLAAMPAIAVVTTTSSGSAAAGSFALLVPQSNSTAITFSWMPTPYADMYAITYRTADSTVVKVVNSTSESVTIFGLKPAMIYYFKVASYSGGQLVSSSQEVAFSTTSEPTATATTTVIVVAVVAVIVGMGIVFVIVVIIMVTLARRSSNGEPQSSCATVYKLIHSILSTRGCCSKTKQANYGASQPWRTTSSALAGSSSSTAAITGMLGRSVEALAAASAAAAAADRPAPQSPVTPSVPPFDGPSAAPLFPSSVMGVTAGSIRGRPGKTYVDPHLYEDPRNAVREFARELDPSCITIESVIGGGEFGDVCRGILRLPGSSDAIVAIKTLKGGASEKSRLDFLTEASIMGQFSDPNIIFLEGVVTKANPIMIVTEFMENGSLDTFLRANDGCLSLGQLLNMLRGIASGMHYLSEMSYVHRDLAARNILVSATLVCKVADFGLSREVEYNESEGAYTTRGGKIPVRWTAPEAIAYRKFTTASDVWSYGVVMWEVMSYGERPYWNWSNHDVIKAVEQDYRLPAPMDCPAAIHQLMLRCWQRERGLRPRFAAIVQVLDNLSRSKDLLPPPAPSVPSIVDLYDLQPVDFPGQAGTAQPHVALRSVLNAIGMECYYAHFVAHGYVTFERLATLTSSALEAIGVSNDEHRSSIVATVQRLARQTVCQRTFNGASTAAATTSSAGFLV